MPPRVPIPATAAAPSLIRTSANATCCLAQTKPSQVSVAAKFSTTASSSFRIKYTKARRQFFEWLDNEGQQHRHHNTPGPNYLTRFGEERNVSRPFRFNPHFISTRVLSEESRELIWRKVMRQGETIKAVSAEYGIDIRRVAAVVRLKEVEKDWLAKVSPFPASFSPLSSPLVGFDMMITTNQFDKSLRQLHGYKLLLRASLIQQPTAFLLCRHFDWGILR